MSPSRRPVRVALASVAVAVLALSACGGGSAAKKATAPAPTTTAPTTPSSTPTTSAAPPAPVNPFTGVGAPSTNPVVAVKIDDTGNGRPQVNLDQADIVYIEQVEGGLTRLLAIYNENLPTVEAVRSTRASDPELVAQYGPIDYVASGGAPNPLQVLDRSPLHTSINDRGGPGFARDGNRAAPYNLTANLGLIAKTLKGGAGPRSIGLTWSSSVDLTGDPVANAINTVVGSTGVRFVWNAGIGRYVRVIDGAQQSTAAGKLIAPPNVIVQFCPVTVYPQDVDVEGNPSQYTHTIGSGHVTVFRNGHRIDGSWSRASATDGTTLKSATGAPIALAPGGAWVVLVATNAPLTD